MGHLGGILEASWDILGILETLGGILETSWEHLVTSWKDLERNKKKIIIMDLCRLEAVGGWAAGSMRGKPLRDNDE